MDLIHATPEDDTVPPFNQAQTPCKSVLIAHLDRDKPLSEPRWVRTGDVQDWLKSMFGRMFWVAGDAAGGWEKKIEVVVENFGISFLSPSCELRSGLYGREWV